MTMHGVQGVQKFKKKCLTTHQTHAILAPNQTTWRHKTMTDPPQNLEKPLENSLHEP